MELQEVVAKEVVAVEVVVVVGGASWTMPTDKAVGLPFLSISSVSPSLSPATKSSERTLQMHTCSLVRSLSLSLSATAPRCPPIQKKTKRKKKKLGEFARKKFLVLCSCPFFSVSPLRHKKKRKAIIGPNLRETSCSGLGLLFSFSFSLFLFHSTTPWRWPSRLDLPCARLGGPRRGSCSLPRPRFCRRRPCRRRRRRRCCPRRRRRRPIRVSSLAAPRDTQRTPTRSSARYEDIENHSLDIVKGVENEGKREGRGVFS